MPPSTWAQIYDPLSAWPLSTAIAALPVVTLFFVLVVLRQRVWVSALAGMLVAIALALAVFGMPAALIGTRRVLGVVFGLMRIAWIIIASIFLYNIAVETGPVRGDEGVDRLAVLGPTPPGGADRVLLRRVPRRHRRRRRPVAIAGAFLIGLGFPPFQAAVLCLLANTAPVAWGGVGNPIRVLAAVTGLARGAAQRDGRPDPAAVLADPADLAGPDDDHLAGHA